MKCYLQQKIPRKKCSNNLHKKIYGSSWDERKTFGNKFWGST